MKTFHLFKMKFYILVLYSVFSVVRTQCHSGYCPEIMPSVCPKIIERSEWGARKATEIHYAIIPVAYAVIHHTGTQDCSTQEECMKIVRSIQTYHLDELDFGHIGYNFLIGGDGNVYEGCGWHRVGAHTYGVNSRSIGIAFIGNYMKKYPSEEQISAAKDLLECAVRLGELYKKYYLYGARQVSGTSSPGLKLYREIQTWPHWSEDLPPKLKID